MVHGDISYETLGVKASSPGVVRIPVSLNAEIGKLQEQLTQLAARVAKLEAK